MSALAIHPSPGTRTAPRHLSLVPALPSAPATQVPAAAPAPRAAAVGPVSQPRLRLTTRGRRVLVALGFAVSIAIGGTVGTLIQGAAPVPEQVATVVVQPGQSLWVIASESAAPHQDVRQVVEQIRMLNGLEHSTVHAGQELSVPAG